VTSTFSTYDHQVHAAMLQGKMCAVCEARETFLGYSSEQAYRTHATNTSTTTMSIRWLPYNMATAPLCTQMMMFQLNQIQ